MRRDAEPESPIPADRLQVVLPADPSSSRRARAEIGSVLDGWGLGDLREPAELLASELVTNAVTHAGSEIELHLRRLPGGVRVEVDDHDDDVDAIRVGHVDAVSPTGRGLLIVDRVADRWGVERTGRGKRVWFELSPAGVESRWSAVSE